MNPLREGIGLAGSILLFAGAACGEPSVTAGTPMYGAWAPEFRELHIRIPLTAVAGAGDDTLTPRSVLVDGAKPAYALWYFDGTPFDYEAISNASRRKIEVFTPVFWRGGDTHTVELFCHYGGKDFSLTTTAAAPTGGAWNKATAPGNMIFRVREEAGIARVNEVADFDAVVEQAFFPDPTANLRATLLDSDGRHTPVPCQVYDVSTHDSLVRFRAAVPLSVPATGAVTVALWHAPSTPVPPPAGPLALDARPDAVAVITADYAIRLSPISGQLMTWHDLRRKILFDYVDPRNLDESARVINRTPDAYIAGTPWTHALDWKTNEYQSATLRGPVFIETTRWGKLPFQPALSASVRYRFVAGCPEVRIATVMSVNQDAQTLAFRGGGISLSPGLFTHAAWPLQSGEIVHVPLEQALGNDTGAPAAARMPVDTPWVALYNAANGYGFAVITARYAYYHKEGAHPPSTRAQNYVSVYRHYTVYTIRSVTQTYLANIRSLPVPIRAGTELYEELVFAPFSLTSNGANRLAEVQHLYRQVTCPLVIVP